MRVADIAASLATSPIDPLQSMGRVTANLRIVDEWLDQLSRLRGAECPSSPVHRVLGDGGVAHQLADQRPRLVGLDAPEGVDEHLALIAGTRVGAELDDVPVLRGCHRARDRVPELPARPLPVLRDQRHRRFAPLAARPDPRGERVDHRPCPDARQPFEEHRVGAARIERRRLESTDRGVRRIDEARQVGRIDTGIAQGRAHRLPLLLLGHVDENRQVPRLPRKNDPGSIAARQESLGLPEADLEAYTKAAESVTGLVSIPVSVAQLAVSLGEYELSEDGEVVETGRAEEEVVVPLAHTEGGLTASVQRGAKAIAESGGCRTYVIADRITRASCFICKDAGDALALARWIEGEVPAMREFLRESDNSELSKYAVLREAKTHVVGPMCHVLWRFTTGDAFGANMMTRNAYALNMAYVLPQAPVPIERSILEANMGGDKKPSFEYFQQGHGKTVIAETTLTETAIERVLRTTRTDLEELAWAGTHGAVASGMQSVAFTPASAIAAVFAATGQDLGLVGTSSMAHGTEQRVEGGLHASIRFPGIEVGTVGGGTTLPDPKRWLELMGCAGPGKVYRLAQLVAATALALEISASAAMATAGSENFFRAHFERGGMR